MTCLRHLAFAACLASHGIAMAGVTVNYVHDARFTDLPRTPWQRQQALEDISAHFQALGKDLPAGQDLVIDVLDIDLAGREEPNRFALSGVRILSHGGDWPRMRLRYSLVEDGKVLKSGDAQLSDKAYGNRVNAYPSDARWPHEKQMIDDWWRATIVPDPGAAKQVSTE
ncbi:DUF3016 domain-containing protein [Massilia phyllosphaerae]|uniref:DUF3016 domain-containing protein n=1 Tax=Massilia phyllosphaerae TaxID=3106034 RepID=UPI002B1CC7A9|nr:DUF3016 domain-containing protein [Massilia sp. SGZ-792]